MTDPITISPANGTWVVRAGDAVIGETTRALSLSEAGKDPVIYFPREDIAMAFLDRSPTEMAGSGVGTANFFSIAAHSGIIADAAWSYETPAAGAEAIAGHLAFHPDKATIERL